MLACVLFTVSLIVGANHVDQAQKERDEALVADGVTARLQDIQASLSLSGIWDGALQRPSGAVDERWARANIGRFMSRTLGFSRVVVLDHFDTPVFAADSKGQVGASSVSDLTHASAALVAGVRQAEARAEHGVGLGSIASSQVTILGRRPVVITASLVQPEFTPQDRQARAPIILSEGAVATMMLAPLTARYHLTDARLLVSARRANGAATIVLAPASGGRGLVLAWRQYQPGTQLLIRSRPLLIIAALAALATIIALFMHARRVARSLVRSRERSAHLAFHDPLTGLGNRALMSERLENARRTLGRENTQYAVLCLDLDRFKDVNEIFGHATGDQLLQEVAARLKGLCRKGDTIARLGGDEFAIVVAASPPTVAALASRIVAALAGPVDLLPGIVTLSCSVGATIVSDATTDPLEALRQADLALYRAKAQGSGRYCFFETEMDGAIKAKRALEDDLRLALANNKLDVAYQPIVLADGGLVALEVLARWTDPVRGIVPPSVFIPAAEEAGMINTIGEAVLKRACKDSLTWPDVRISVNLSPMQMRRPDLVDRVRRIFEETGADPSRFDLEITESCLLKDDSITHEVLADLRALGFGFSLDDFGTGYSSLSYLHQYPVQKMKLDRSFVTRLGHGVQSGMIVAALVMLARALELKVIAEGVETQAELDQLIEFGCHQFQGYLFSKPVDVVAATKLIMQREHLGPDGEPVGCDLRQTVRNQ